MEGGRAERLRRGTSQVRLEWIIVKVHEELQYFHSPDSRGDRGWREFGKEMFDLARPVGREFSLRWVPDPPPLTCWNSSAPHPLPQELK